MITLKCDKCGRETNNPHVFDDMHFSFLDGNDTRAILHSIHLCVTCQNELVNKVNAAIAEFLGEDEIYEWRSQRSII